MTGGRSPLDVEVAGDGPDLAAVWQTPSLNAFLALGRPAWTMARAWLTEILRDDVHRDGVSPHLHHLDDVTLHLPVEVADADEGVVGGVVVVDAGQPEQAVDLQVGLGGVQGAR